MNVDAILKLAEAGFTADEIRKMDTGQLPIKPAAKADPEPEEKEEETKEEPEEQPEEDPEAKKTEPKMVFSPASEERILKAINKLTGSITAFMVATTGTDTPADDLQDTADQILKKAFFMGKED